MKYKIVTPGYLFFSGTLPSVTVTGGIVTSFSLEVGIFVNSDRFSIYEIDPAGLTPEKGVPSWLHLQMAFNSEHKNKTG